MRYPARLILFASVLLCLLVTSTFGQQSAQERAASLRAQLAAVQAKQAELQMRLQQLEEALKPENIQNSLAGVGSTRPEELREQRRRQLEIEKTGVSAQLDQLAASRIRLEAAVVQADADAYHQSARPNVAGPNSKDPDAASGDSASATRTNNAATVHRQRRVKKYKAKRRY